LKDPGSDSEQRETKQSTIVTINISIATAIVSVREHRFRFRFGSHLDSINKQRAKETLHWWSSLDIIRIMSAQAFWDVAAPLIAVTEKHPFLVAMVDGSLDMDSFQYYVVQDALYLHDFAYALRRLGDNDGISRQDSERLHAFAKGAEEAELSLHNSFFKEWNISDDGVEQMPHSLLYTSYMKQVVATRPHAEGLAVLLPCFWVYMHVGQCMLKLRQELGDSVQRPPQFDAWIDMYGGEDFEHEVKDYIAMNNKACQSADVETLKNMEKHFLTCCKLEHMFWDQAQEQMQWPVIA
jgi:thiaminase/transcriptional activator TenA